MTSTLSLTIIEIVLLLFGAIILGITIHFFLASRRNLNAATRELDEKGKVRDEWKLRYFNDMEERDKEINEWKARFKERDGQAREAEENAELYINEADEVRKNNKQLKFELEQLQGAQARLQEELKQRSEAAAGRQTREEVSSIPESLASDVQLIEQLTPEPVPRANYLDELRLTQQGLQEHHQRINQLIGHIDLIKEKEEREREILQHQEWLENELDQVRNALGDKEREISSIREKEKLTIEMSSRLDSAYHEFQMLQEKIGRLENQLHQARLGNLELEDLREQHISVSRELDTHRHKTHQLTVHNQQLTEQLAEAEAKLREANHHRQQLQKKAAYLEEVNTDLQVVSEANKKLETQLRRIGELESMLNVVSEERDHLATRNG